MLKDIVEARPLDGYRIYIRFEDGADGEVDLSKLVEFTGVFEALRAPEEVRKVTVDPELGTIGWPNGADLDPDVLYSQVTGQATKLEPSRWGSPLRCTEFHGQRQRGSDG